MIEKLSPKKAYLTHLGHKMGLHSDTQKELPKYENCRNGLK